MQPNQLDSTKFLDDAEDQALLGLLNRSRCRNSLMIALLRNYGMRSGELLRLRPSSINKASRSIRVCGLKGSSPREFPLSDDHYSRLIALCKSDDRPIFDITKQRLGQIWNKWRPAKKKLHSLRHTCAVNLYKAHRDIKLVQKVLGHKSISNTMIYMDFVYTQEEFRNVFLGRGSGIAPAHETKLGGNLLQFHNYGSGHEVSGGPSSLVSPRQSL